MSNILYLILYPPTTIFLNAENVNSDQESVLRKVWLQ